MKTRDYFKEASFVDFKGKERKFMIAAIIEDFENETIPTLFGNVILSSEHVINFGISITHETDEYKEDLAKVISKGKALSEKRCIHQESISIKMLTKKTVIDAFMDAFVSDMQCHPEKYITGYDKAKTKWRKIQLNKIK